MTCSVCHAALELLVRLHHRSVTIPTMELQTNVLSTVAECYLGDVTLTFICLYSCYGNRWCSWRHWYRTWLTVYAMLRELFNYITN